MKTVLTVLSDKKGNLILDAMETGISVNEMVIVANSMIDGISKVLEIPKECTVALILEVGGKENGNEAIYCNGSC